VKHFIKYYGSITYSKTDNSISLKKVIKYHPLLISAMLWKKIYSQCVLRSSNSIPSCKLHHWYIQTTVYTNRLNYDADKSQKLKLHINHKPQRAMDKSTVKLVPADKHFTYLFVTSKRSMSPYISPWILLWLRVNLVMLSILTETINTIHYKISV
jgi:hypothetical protein